MYDLKIFIANWTLKTGFTSVPDHRDVVNEQCTDMNVSFKTLANFRVITLCCASTHLL
jgi:hypothetical protein